MGAPGDETAADPESASDRAADDDADAEAATADLLPETIHGRSLVGAVLMGGLVAVLWASGSLEGPTGLAVGLLFPLYFVVGTYRPLRERIPFYDQWLAVPLLAYGLYLVGTEGPSLLGVGFVALGLLGLGQVVREWYVDTEVSDPE